jgi:inosine/xanthosine triphosphate pyrophosphatase family protein
VDDSILDVEGAKIGINIRWMLDHLSQFEGHKALWTVHLAYREKGRVLVFEGKVKGTIVPSRGGGDFGFNPVFQPEGSDKTLAESKPDSVNARALAVEALMQGRVKVTKPAMDDWNGRWQEK